MHSSMHFKNKRVETEAFQLISSEHLSRNWCTMICLSLFRMGFSIFLFGTLENFPTAVENIHIYISQTHNNKTKPFSILL